MSKSELLQIEKEVASLLQSEFGEEKPKFIVAVSGGPDSMALLYLFQKFNIDALVAHINYGKRGQEADKDTELVEEMAHQWGFDCHTVKVDPDEAGNTNFQQWARKVRYNIFRSMAAEYGATGIALAHHRDDQIETILQKLFRGAGLESWTAMEVWNGELFRPLLKVSKREIEEYCDQKAIPYRIDASNLESDFARNFLRNEWLDKLEEHFPGWKQNILRLPEQAKVFTSALDRISEKITDEKDRINRQQLMAIEPELARALLLRKVKQVDPEIELSRDALKQMDQLEELQTGKSIQLSSSYSILRDREWFKIVYDKPEALMFTRLEQEGLKKKPFTFNGIHFTIETYNDPDFEQALYLDAVKLKWPLTLRNWKPGDSFQPLGMEGHQKVSDHLTNRKVSAARKKSALVLVSFDETICAVIFPPIENRRPPGTIAESAKCDRTTGSCLKIK